MRQSGSQLTLRGVRETTWKREWAERMAAFAIFLAIFGAVYALCFGIAAVRGGSNPHSDDPCASTYQGPPAECIPHAPTGLP